MVETLINDAKARGTGKYRVIGIGKVDGRPKNTVSYRIGKLMPVALKYIEDVVNGEEKRPNATRVQLCLRLVGHLMKSESEGKVIEKIEEAALAKVMKHGKIDNYDKFIKTLHEEEGICH